MNVLEKILEEIKEVEKEYVTGHKVLYALGATGMATEISHIIRSHMDEAENVDWIPVEKRLPEEYEEVLIWENLNKRCLTARFYDNDFHISSPDMPFDPIAWHPFPEPYKDGRER